jgi:hypothetical protein
VRDPWSHVAVDAWFLSLEACNVIALRTLQLALGGPTVNTEIHRMVEEKAEAFITLQWLLWTGGLGTTAAAITGKSLKHYQRTVRRNLRRLSKSPS